MIQLFKKLSIRIKLILLTLSITLIAICVGFGLVIFHDIYQFKQDAIRQIQLIGNIVADYSVPDLLFQDQIEAQKTLNKLRRIKNLQFAVMYDTQHQVFSRLDIQEKPDQHHAIQLSIPIQDSLGRDLGSLFLSISDIELTKKITAHIFLMLECLVITLLITWIFVLIFQRIITEPILHLADIAKQISKEGAHHIRVTKHSEDEIGVLYDGFNAMLGNIYVREQQQKQIESDLQKAKEMADSANQTKSKFLASMSHELRTPLNSLLILAKDLTKNQDENLTPDQMESVHIIHKSGKDLLHLINNILDISKIEAGKMDVILGKISLEAISHDFKHLFKAIAKENQLDFQIHITKEIASVSIVTDQQKLYQILKNLLSNAFKFTSVGSVRLSIKRPDQVLIPQSADMIAFEIQDTGIGIPIEKQALIFEPFKQAQKTTHRDFGGTGLGLSISKELAQMLGGDIIVSSEKNKGSTFTLILPVQIQVPVKPENGYAKSDYQNPIPDDINLESIPASFSHKTLLIVDDDMRNSFALSKICKQAGFMVILAQNGKKALEKLNQVSKVDAILMDIFMPEMDGIEAIQKIKQNPSLNSIPIIALSALTTPEKKEECLAHGATYFLAKPIDIDQLMAIFKGLFHQ